MGKDQQEDLINKYLQNKCTDEERRLIERWIDTSLITEQWDWKSLEHKTRVKNSIKNKIDAKKVRKQPRISYKVITIAASIFMVIGICTVMYLFQREEKQVPTMAATPVKPGTKAATLILSNGDEIKLDKFSNGELFKEAGVSIQKIDSGMLSYEFVKQQSSEKVSMNTLLIPRGGEYQLTLSDGTKVWLNSESSLHFPSHFPDGERLVELKGEAYFEVKNNSQPFTVKAKDNKIVVLGTKFNIYAYPEQNGTFTTLLEGKVQVHRKSVQLTLMPGQQAFNVNQELKKKVVDAEAAIAWKNGYFLFDDQPLEDVMPNIARWYNIEYTINRNGKTGKKINGKYSKAKSIDELFQFLEKLEVARFKKEGRRVIVTI